MARMHSRKRGKASSKKPIKKVLPTWVIYKEKEVELLIQKYSKEGKSASEIGMILRDTYGIPDTRLITKKKISKILAEKGLNKEVPEDLLFLIKKAVMLNKHLERNKKDMTAKRGSQLTLSKIRRMTKYYIRMGKIDENWKFDPDKAALYTE
jgi:small subunit ribosomal protein S15